MGSLKKFYNNWITIYRLAGSADNYGGTTNRWDKKSWDKHCRIYSTSGMMRLVYQGIEYYVTNRLVCEHDVDVKPGDKVEDNTGSFYYVLSMNDVNRTQKSHHKECLLSRMDA
jgi:hypothetical protein